VERLYEVLSQTRGVLRAERSFGHFQVPEIDRVILERFCDVMQKENADVLLDAYLIAQFFQAEAF